MAPAGPLNALGLSPVCLPLGKFAASDGKVSRATRARLRRSGEACLRRTPGPKVKKGINKLSRSAFYKRRAKRLGTKVIVAGAGPGRVGSTALAAHLQREGFHVTHEAGNSRSVDFDPGTSVPDHFNLFAKPKKFKLLVANEKVLTWLDRASGASVVGDIGLSNTQHMEELLEADKRVVLVVQLRDPGPFAASVIRALPRCGRVETGLMQARGITAATVPDRQKRLQMYMRLVTEEAAKLRKKYGDRVWIVNVKRLAVLGPQILRSLGAQCTTWDAELGRNSNNGRLLQRRASEARAGAKPGRVPGASLGGVHGVAGLPPGAALGGGGPGPGRRRGHGGAAAASAWRQRSRASQPEAEAEDLHLD